MQLLLDNGAEVDVIDTLGNTPLGTAVMNSKGKGEVITMLLKAGADPHIKNNWGVSPYSIAHSIDNYDIKQWFH